MSKNEILLAVLIGYIISVLVCFRSPYAFMKPYYWIVPLLVVGLFLIFWYLGSGKEAKKDSKE